MMKKVILLVLSLICLSFSTLAQETSSQKEVEVSTEILETYIGKYELGPNAVIDVTKDKAQLYIQLTGQGKAEIFPSSKTKFFLKVVEATLVFNKDDNGDVVSLTLYQNGRDITATKIE